MFIKLLQIPWVAFRNGRIGGHPITRNPLAWIPFLSHYHSSSYCGCSLLFAISSFCRLSLSGLIFGGDRFPESLEFILKLGFIFRMPMGDAPSLGQTSERLSANASPRWPFTALFVGSLLNRFESISCPRHPMMRLLSARSASGAYNLDTMIGSIEQSRWPDKSRVQAAQFDR